MWKQVGSRGHNEKEQNEGTWAMQGQCRFGKGLCQENKNSKNPRLLCRSHSEFCLLENRPKIAQNQY